MTLIQLSLWVEDGKLDRQCSHCGWRENILPDLCSYEHQVQVELLEHPRVRALHKPAYRFFEAVLPTFLTLGKVGLTQLVDEDFPETTVYRQLRTLVKAGIIRTEPKREGGVYHLYALALTNASSKSERKSERILDSTVLSW